jgi:hypothetical protein
MTLDTSFLIVDQIHIQFYWIRSIWFHMMSVWCITIALHMLITYYIFLLNVDQFICTRMLRHPNIVSLTEAFRRKGTYICVYICICVFMFMYLHLCICYIRHVRNVYSYVFVFIYLRTFLEQYVYVYTYIYTSALHKWMYTKIWIHNKFMYLYSYVCNFIINFAGKLYLVFEYVEMNLLEVLEEQPQGLDPVCICIYIYIYIYIFYYVNRNRHINTYIYAYVYICICLYVGT